MLLFVVNGIIVAIVLLRGNMILMVGFMTFKKTGPKLQAEARRRNMASLTATATAARAEEAVKWQALLRPLNSQNGTAPACPFLTYSLCLSRNLKACTAMYA